MAEPTHPEPPYHGRFAPTPSGPLHLGSLVAALASCLDARACGGRWTLRIDDLDGPRSAAGAEVAICTALERLGFTWDGPVVHQAPRTARYRTALERLAAAGLTYPCGCTRREVAGRPYPGTCRAGVIAGRAPRAVRLCTPAEPITVEDLVQGRYRQDLRAAIGDFVILRADGLFAYHLATVVDDAEAGITRVVRGADLLDSTPRQVHLQRCLGLATPQYAHLPVILGAGGVKLSKQNRARPVDPGRPGPLLATALRLLGQAPPDELGAAPLTEIWRWAVAAWRLERVPRAASSAAPEGAAPTGARLGPPAHRQAPSS